MKPIRYWPLYILSVFCISAAVVSAADCPTIVKSALDATNQACSATERNQACYGNISLTAEAQAGVPAFTFTKPGDLVDIVGVKTFILSPLDPTSDTWGVALMKIQANLPETLPGQNVTLILFGDVEINNAATEDQTPMQAFYFKSGLNDAPCEQAPDSGLLIQTPEGQHKINLTVDEVEITLGSSAYFQAQADGELTVSVVEGEGTVTAAGVTVTIPAGSRARVPLDANLAPSGPPIGPEPYTETDLASLPLGLLPQTITIAPALEATASADAIVPQPGNWSYVVTDAVGVGECAPYVSIAMFPKLSLTLGEGDFDVLEFMASSGTGNPANVQIERPSPNQYTAAIDEAGQKIFYVYNIVSETEMQVTGNAKSDACDMTLTISITHLG